MKVELFHAPGCSRCAAAREGLKAAAQMAVAELEWREINVLDELDYAWFEDPIPTTDMDGLIELRSKLSDAGALYWLDAHWCAAGEAAGESSQCPLLDELSAIGKLNDRSVILIDDARLFLAPPLSPHEISQWPTFHEILSRLLSMGTGHELMVINDVIAFFPASANSALVSHAQAYGTDWLNAAVCLRENG